MNNIPFIPTFGSTKSRSVSSTSASVGFTAGSHAMCVANTGDEVIYITTSIGARDATTDDYPILPNSKEIITIGSGHNTFSAITASGTSAALITTGSGF